MVDRTLQGTNGGDRVDLLPEQVGRIEIGADHRADSFAQAQQGRWIVDIKAGVHLDRNPDPVVFSEFASLLPIRDQLFVPLPFLDNLVFGRPGSDHPVRVGGCVGITGTAREGDHGLDAQLFGHQDSRFKIFMVLTRNLSIGMDRIAVHRQRRDLKTRGIDRRLERLQRSWIREEFLRIAMRRARIATDTDLQFLHSLRLQIRQSLIERQITQNHRKNAQFHNQFLQLCRKWDAVPNRAKNINSYVLDKSCSVEVDGAAGFG